MKSCVVGFICFVLATTSGLAGKVIFDGIVRGGDPGVMTAETSSGPVFTSCPASTNLGCNPNNIPDCDPNIGATNSCAASMSQYLLVSSFGTWEVKRYNAVTGTFVDTVGSFSNGGLQFPEGIRYGPDGNFYVSSSNPNVVKRFDGVTGMFIDIFASGGNLGAPQDLVFGPDGNLYVCSSTTHEVKRYNGTTGVFIDTFVTAGSGGLSFPQGLVFGLDTNLYVSSSGSHGIKRYDGATGAFVDNFVTTNSGGLSFPQGLIFGPDGNLYVSSNGSDEVKRYNGTSGAFIDSFISTNSGGLISPQGLVFGPDNNLYVCSTKSANVKRYNGATGAFMDNFASGGGLMSPTFLTFSPSLALDQNPQVTCEKVDTTNGCAHTRTITYTAASPCGTNTCVQIINWTVDTAPPVINCASNKTVPCGASWNFDSPEVVTNTCSGTNVILTVLGTVTNGTGCGQTYTRTWMATDQCGNTNTCSQTVTSAAPPMMMTCASNKTVVCGAGWSFDPPIVSDGCSGTNVSLSYVTVTNGFCPQLITRTWTAADPCGNTNTCSQTVSVEVSGPQTKPVIVGIGYNATGVHLVIETLSCYVYSLECKQDLSDPTWNSCQTMIGTGGNEEFIDPPPLSFSRFYRVRLLCP